MLSTTIPAIVSVGLNVLFLPHFRFIGAAIVSVLTKSLSMADSTVLYRHYLGSYRVYDKNYFASARCMASCYL